MTRCLVALLSIVGLSPNVAVADSAKFEVLPKATLAFSNGSSKVEAGIEVNESELKDTGWRTRFLVSAPLDEGSDNLVTIERGFSGPNGSLEGAVAGDWAGTSGDLLYTRSALTLSLGYNIYTWKTVEGVDDKIGAYDWGIRWNNILYHSSEGESQFWRHAPQLQLGVERAFEKSKPVAVLAEGAIQPTALPIRIVEGPKDEKVFVGQLYYWNKLLLRNTKWATAPGGSVRTMELDFSGEYSVQPEFWVFVYPLAKDEKTIRVGASPFIRIERGGDEEKETWGGLFRVDFNQVSYEL